MRIGVQLDKHSAFNKSAYTGSRSRDRALGEGKVLK
jgi:hypothetical protein